MSNEPETVPDDTLGQQIVDLGAGSGPAWLMPLLVGLAWGAVALALIVDRPW